MKVDFSDVPDVRPIPAGEYEVVIVNAQLGESQTGNPVLELTYELLGGEAIGAKVTEKLSLLPQSLWRLKALCSVIDVPTEGEIEICSELFEGKGLTVKIRERHYNGRTFPEIVRYARFEEKVG